MAIHLSTHTQHVTATIYNSSQYTTYSLYGPVHSVYSVYSVNCTVSVHTIHTLVSPPIRMHSIHSASCLFTRLDESSRVLPGFLTDQFQQKKSIYEVFVLMGELSCSFSWLLQCRKRKVKTSLFVIILAFQASIFLKESSKEKHHPISPQKNKGFINVFCRKWAVRNPAGTRLDSSSLVNKQVVHSALYNINYAHYTL